MAGDALSIPLTGLVPAIVIARPNRFVAEVRLGDTKESVLAHVADSGRLRELIFPGNPVMVRRAGAAPTAAATAATTANHGSTQLSPQRKTPFDLVLASTHASPPAGSMIWVSVDTRYPNTLFGQALRAGVLQEFDRGCEVSAEYWYHHLSPWKEEAAKQAGEKTRPVRSRMDFYLGQSASAANLTSGPSCLVEVKSVTLCRDGVGYFPDAPTDRGARHLHELTRGVKEGYRAYAVFIAQREDIRVVRPNREMDPAFADALEEAVNSGVTLLGYRCFITPSEIRLDPSVIPVEPGDA